MILFKYGYMFYWYICLANGHNIGSFNTIENKFFREGCNKAVQQTISSQYHNDHKMYLFQMATGREAVIRELIQIKRK